MAYRVEFRVIGEPQTKGSFRALLGKNGRPFVIPDNAHSKAWEKAVRLVADRVKPPEPLDCPLRVEVEFTLERPLKPKFAAAPAARLDLDKLLRSTLDALTDVIYRDDSRIVELVASKRFGSPIGARIVVASLESQDQLPGLVVL